MTNYVEDLEQIRLIWERVAQNLSSFNSKPTEISYIFLKNISIICESQPAMFFKYLDFFFISYKDQFYIKEEKLKILVYLANNENIDQILLQIKEYIQEVDVNFVRLCIKTLG